MADEAGRALDARGRAYKLTVCAIAIGIALFAAAQAAYAASVGSAQFLKDALDWTYTILLNAVAAFVFGRGARIERLSAFAVALILAVGGVHTLYDLWDKVAAPRPIDPDLLGFSAVSATVIGYLTAGALVRFRHDANPLIQATWLSARNDAVVTTVNAAVTLAVRLAPVRWPEYAMDLLAAGLAFQAAAATVRATRRASRDPRPAPPRSLIPATAVGLRIRGRTRGRRLAKAACPALNRLPFDGKRSQ